MKVKFEKGYVLVISGRLTYLCGMFNGSPALARAAAFFPFIFVRSENEIVSWVMNHERIHLRQQREMLQIGNIILEIIETVYALFYLRKTLKEIYLWRSSEQEAYRNQHNQNYLDHRPFWSQLKYLKNKKEFKLGNPGEVIFASSSADPNNLSAISHEKFFKER